MKKETTEHGGTRNNSGRKKLDANQKSVTLTIYPKQYEIDNAGGIDNAKLIALNAIKNAKPE